MDNLSIVTNTQLYLQLGSHWKHNNGNAYILDSISNAESDREEYPTIINYHGTDFNHWSKPIEEFLSKMTPCDSTEFKYDILKEYFEIEKSERGAYIIGLIEDGDFSFNYSKTEFEEIISLEVDNHGGVCVVEFPLIGIDQEQFVIKFIDDESLASIRAYVLEYGVQKVNYRVL